MHESSKEKVLFFDLFLSLSKGNLYTVLQIKATDCYLYLEYTHHLIQIMKSTVYGQAQFCSLEDFKHHKSSIRSWFLKRRYSEKIIAKKKSMVKFNFSRKIKPK